MTIVQRIRFATLTLLLASTPLLIGTTASAEGSVWKRLKGIHPRTEKYTAADAGGARVYVRANEATLKSTVTDFAHYAEMISLFEEAKIVGKNGEQTDVYLKVPILKGRSRIWAVLRFDPPRKAPDGTTVLEGHMIKGNVRRFDAVYRFRQVDAEGSELSLEMQIVPTLPAPRSYIVSESADASDTAVRRLRDNAQRREKK